jgi:ADP-ribose pyrophosphatase
MQSDSARLARYLAFARARPELFDNAGAAVRVLLDPAEIAAVEQTMRERLRARGLSAADARAQSAVGIVFDDPWIFVLRDAVEFPDGSRRTHTRTLNRVGQGAAVLPVLDGDIVLTRQYRHAVRGFLLEIPRGGIEPGQTPEAAARSELKEEIGAEAGALVPLGFLHGSTNLYASGAHLFFCRLTTLGRPQLHEGIVGIERLAPRAFETKLLAGEIVDSFTVAAFAHARLRGLL